VFRTYVRRYVDPPLRWRRPREGVFPLMKLPVELRIMIAEYALAYNGGLDWYWKEKDGTRIGRLKPAYCFKRNPEDFCPTQVLCLSRQLYEETSQIWLKVNTLNFDGDEDKLIFNAQTYDSVFGEAIDNFEFFLRHLSPEQVAKIQTVAIQGMNVTESPNTVQRIFSLTSMDICYDVQVIDTRWHYTADITDTVDCASEFMEKGGEIQAWLQCNIKDRGWRVYPYCRGGKDKYSLRYHLSAVDFQIARDYIRNGI
jgi:hypothetical protein